MREHEPTDLDMRRDVDKVALLMGSDQWRGRWRTPGGSVPYIPAAPRFAGRRAAPASTDDRP